MRGADVARQILGLPFCLPRPLLFIDWRGWLDHAGRRLEDLIRNTQHVIEDSSKIREHSEAAKRRAEELIGKTERLRTERRQSTENERLILDRPRVN